MDILTHWKVTTRPVSTRVHAGLDDFREAQKAQWVEMVLQMRAVNWSQIEAFIRSRGGDDVDVSRLAACCYPTPRSDIRHCSEWHGLGDYEFATATEILAERDVTVTLEYLAISSDQLNRLARKYSQRLSEETLVEVIAVKMAAG